MWVRRKTVSDGSKRWRIPCVESGTVAPAGQWNSMQPLPATDPSVEILTLPPSYQPRSLSFSSSKDSLKRAPSARETSSVTVTMARILIRQLYELDANQERPLEVLRRIRDGA